MLYNKYTENETGIVVDVATPYTWCSDIPLYVVVRYSELRSYVIDIDSFNKHFTIVTPQLVSISSTNEYARPTEQQRAIEELGGCTPTSEG